MNTKSTPDERFLIKLYQMANEKGDPCSPVDSRLVAKAVGMKETALKNILKHLAQANFVKKLDDSKVYLTERGCALVLESIG